MFRNTNPLVRAHGNDWDIGLSKTGFINEAGKCLVMQAWVNNKPTIIVLLDSWGKLTRVGDAIRIKRWMESASLTQKTKAGLPVALGSAFMAGAMPPFLFALGVETDRSGNRRCRCTDNG